MKIPPVHDIAKLARNYRQLVLWVALQLLISLLAMLLPNTLPLVFGVSLLVSAFALAYYSFQTAEALGQSGLSWAVAMLVPGLNLITLAALSSKATQVCRANNIPVGLLGPQL